MKRAETAWRPLGGVTAGLVFGAALALYIGTSGGSMATTDAVVTFDVTKGLVERHSLALSGNLLGLESMRGADGRYYSPFGIVPSLYNVPFYLAGRQLRAAVGVGLGSADTLPKAAVTVGGAVAAALVVWATFLLAWRLYGKARGAFIAAGLLAAGTLLWPYSKFGFNQPLAALFVVLAALALLRGVRREWSPGGTWAGVWTGLAMLTRHETGLLAVALAVYLFAAKRQRPDVGKRLAVRFGLAFLAAVFVWGTLNAVRFGDPLEMGLLRDPTPAFGSPIAKGLAGLLFSPGASLFLYSPVVLLAVPALWRLWREDRPTAWLLGAPVVLMLLLYAQLGNWVGGRSYGGRYLVVVLPLCCAALPPWLAIVRGSAARWLITAVCLTSVAVQIPGVAMDFAKAGLAWARQYPAGSLPDRRYVWSASPLVVNTKATFEAIPANLRYLTGRAAPPAVARTARDGDRDFSQQFAFSLDFWWLYAFYLGLVPAWLALVAGGTFAATALALGLSAWRLAAWHDGGDARSPVIL
jgi:hypothetical protein